MTFLNDRLLKAQISDGLMYWLYIPSAVILSGMIADRLLGLPVFSGNLIITVSAAVLIVAGCAFIQKSIKDLALYGDGTPNPLRPPRRLVVEGSYSLCRHPMFFGYDLAALGVVLLFGSWGMLLLSYPVFILLGCRFLRAEEQKLQKRFGEGFREYQKRVPMLVPFVNREGRFS